MINDLLDLSKLESGLARLDPEDLAVRPVLEKLLDGLRLLQRPRDLLVTMGASLVIWYVIYWQVRVALLAFDIELLLRAAYFLVTLSVKRGAGAVTISKRLRLLK